MKVQLCLVLAVAAILPLAPLASAQAAKAPAASDQTTQAPAASDQAAQAPGTDAQAEAPATQAPTAQAPPTQTQTPATKAQPAKVPATPAAAPPKVADSNLEAVLTQLDRAADAFRFAQADFVWDQFQKVVEETDTQKGVIFFRRHGKDTDMAADVKTPEAKYVLFSDGKLRLFQPRIDQVTEYDVGKKRADVETFLVLGFGGRGHDLLRSFDVKLLKREPVDGVNTAVLELTPKTPRVRNMFNRMLLWVDPARGVSIKQQFFEPSGDYRLAHYQNINVKDKIPDEAFKLKTTASTKVVSPQS